MACRVCSEIVMCIIKDAMPPKFQSSTMMQKIQNQVAGLLLVAFIQRLVSGIFLVRTIYKISLEKSGKEPGRVNLE
jgi:hypothetical protein